MVIKASPFIPGHENSGIVPVLAVHDGIDLLRDEILRSLQRSRGMITGTSSRRSYPRDAGQLACLNVFNKLVRTMDITWRFSNRLNH